jgi:uncharacterized protein (DUF1697 family)
MLYAAFMRGLNLGKRNVKMDDLRKIFVKAGFTNVESFIASGNIVFESPSKDTAALEKKIEGAIERAYGYASETFIRDFGALAKIGKAMPFKGIHDAPTYVVGFLRDPLDAARKKAFLGLAAKEDQFATIGREVYWHSTIGQGESKFSANVFDKTLGIRSTWRNLRTVRRMVERWGSG